MTISTPTKITVPFANSAGSSYKRTVPVASQIGITNGAASYTDGFPPLTMTALASGGVPPFGQDVNGILYAITQALQFQQAGGFYVYDSEFQTSVDGYPQGALVMASDYSGLWLNTVANNTTAPETGGEGWVPYYQYGKTTIALLASNVELTSLQAAKDVITLTGAITANLVVTMPSYVRNWSIYNNTTGNYTVTVKYAVGAGVILQSGTNFVFGDGSNIYENVFIGLGIGQTWQSLTSSRAIGTIYTNTTGRPIAINVTVNDLVNNNLALFAGGVLVDYFTDAGSYSINAKVSGIVPVGATYQLTVSSGSATIINWSELR